MHIVRTLQHFLHPPDMSKSEINSPTSGGCISEAYRRSDIKKDWELLLMKAEHHPSLQLALQASRAGSWLKVCYDALDYGPTGTKHQTAHFGLMTQPTFVTLLAGQWM